MTDQQEIGGDMLTVKKVAARWKMRPRQARKIIRAHSKVLVPVKIGRKILITPENLLKFERERRVYSDE